MRSKKFDDTKPCSWCNPCQASFCDCGECDDLKCKVCYPCKDCKQVETGVEDGGIKETILEPCENCIEETAIKNIQNFAPYPVVYWRDGDSEGAGGDR